MKRPKTKQITNRKAHFDYDLKDSYLAGLVLTGSEVKSLRQGQGNLRGAYINLRGGEVWLIGAQITPIATNKVALDETMQTRDRKLLLEKREIQELFAAKQQGMTIVPTKIMNKLHHIKIEISIGRGKRKYDKRETIKKRDQERQARQMRTF